MATDDERRRVAAKLREYASWDDEGCLVDCQEWGESVLNLLDCGDTEGENYAALAALIDPDCDASATHTDGSATCDMSQSRRSDVNPTECGIDSIYNWCFSGLEGSDEDEDELYCDIMRAIEEYRHPERVTARTARPVDREALLALAEEMDHPIRQAAWNQTAGVRREHIMAEYSRRIREACGVSE